MNFQSIYNKPVELAICIALALLAAVLWIAFWLATNRKDLWEVFVDGVNDFFVRCGYLTPLQAENSKRSAMGIALSYVIGAEAVVATISALAILIRTWRS